MALTRLCPASLAGRRALAPRIWGGRAHALIGYPGLRPTSPRTPGRGPARPFHGPLRETRNGHTPVTRAVPFVCIRWTNLFRFAQSFIGTKANSVLRSKVYLHNSSQHRCLLARRVIARRNLRPALHARRARADGGRARASRDDVVGARLVARIARIRTRHTAGAHAPMNTPNEHPHGCHTSAHPIPSSLAAAAHA